MITAFFGKIYTSFSPVRSVESVIVIGDSVVYAGRSDAAEKLCKSLPCDEVDISKGVGMPGFIDSHMHLSGLALQEHELDLRGVRSIRELRQRLSEFIAARPDSSSIIGRGWDEGLFEERRPPTRLDIDDITGTRPTLLIRVCGHVGLLNTSAMRLLGVGPGQPNVDVKDGEPSGLVREELVLKALRELEPPHDIYMSYIRDTVKSLLRQGITTIGFMNTPMKLLPSLLSEGLSGSLKIRLRLYLDLEGLSWLEQVADVVQHGIGNQWVKVNGVKVFADGSLGARTAFLSAPYNDDADNYGQALLAEPELRDIIERASRLSLQTAVHAIGDAAVDLVLRASSGLREHVRIEHASLVRDDQLPSLRGYRVSVQPMFVVDDAPWIASRIGKERLCMAYRFRSLLSAGAIVGLSTDSPVEPTDPWLTVSAAVNGASADGVPYGERLTVSEALHLYTRGSADVLRDPLIGSLEPGSLGDLIVASRDPLEVDPSELRSISTVGTYVGGVKVA